MHPILVDFGTHTLPLLGPTHLFLPTYGLLFAAGALLAWAWFVKRSKAMGLPQDPVFNLAFYSLLAGLLGAKITLVLVDLPFYLANPVEILGTIRSAGVLMGGIAAGIAAFVVYALRKGLPLHELGDAVAAPLALAQGIGRLGCFAAGCCWGVESQGWCAVRFTDPAAHAQTGVPLDVPLIPIQLLQAGFDIGLAGFLTILWRRRTGVPGSVFWTYLILYGLGRGVLEFLRGDSVRGMWLGGTVSTSQILSAAAVIVGLVFLIVERRRAATETA